MNLNFIIFFSPFIRIVDHACAHIFFNYLVVLTRLWLVVGATKFSEHATRIVLGSKMLGVRLLKRTHLRMCISRGSTTGLESKVLYTYMIHANRSQLSKLFMAWIRRYSRFSICRIGSVLRSVDLSGLGSRLVIWSTII